MDNLDPTSRGPNIDARKLGVLEKFFGQSLLGMVADGGPNSNFSASLDLGILGTPYLIPGTGR